MGRLRGLRIGLLAAALGVAGAIAFYCCPAAAQQPEQTPKAEPSSPTQAPSVPQAAPAAAQDLAEGCPDHPDALGTSRVLAIDPAEYPRVGRMQYADSLPLNDKEVVLTFDDGPLLPYSNQVLDILAAQCVKATYFLVGEMARAFPATVRRMYEQGHTIGTHSDNHPTRFGQLPVEKLRQEIDWGISDVSAALGDPKYLAPFFRVPGLARSDLAESELAARGLSVFSSDTVADDWHHRIRAKQIIAAAMRRLEARGKGILLLHDIHPVTVAALPGLLKELKDKGFHIVQVVPAASYVIAMANKPKARIASAVPGAPILGDDPDRGAPTRWPQAVASATPEESSLPVPDVAAFEPDALAAEDVGDVHWPAQEQAIAPAQTKTKAARRKHKLARSSEKRHAHSAHPSKDPRQTEHARSRRSERAGTGGDGHQSDLASRLKSFSALSTPAQAH